MAAYAVHLCDQPASTFNTDVDKATMGGVVLHRVNVALGHGLFTTGLNQLHFWCCVLVLLPVVEDLMRLVQASASAPDLQARLRDTLNMARDTDKWKKLTRMLSERVSGHYSTAPHSRAY
jgi:hypothetical protein